MKIGIIGARGFFGSVLFEVTDKNRKFTAVEITRENYSLFKSERFDVVVNCAMPSGRFWAQQNPDDDFRETVEKTHKIYHDFGRSRVIQISSVSARSQLNTVYGRHKRAAESIIDNGNNLIVRLGPLYHETLKKGALIDIAKGREVFVSADSKYAFTPVRWACETILRRINENGIIEIGARDSISLGYLAKKLESPSHFFGERDDQIFENAPKHAPVASAVIDFALSVLRKGGLKSE